MTDEQKITMVKALTDESDDSLVSVYLEDAKAAILRRRYPFGLPDDADISPLYEMIQVKLAARYLLRKGGEGETKHSENGIDRTYGSVNDEDLLMEVTPFAKVI